MAATHCPQCGHSLDSGDDWPACPDGMKDFGEWRISRDLWEVLIQVRSAKYALPQAGITTLDQVRAMTEDDLLEINGVGYKTVRALRDAVAPGPALPLGAGGEIVVTWPSWLGEAPSEAGA